VHERSSDPGSISLAAITGASGRLQGIVLALWSAQELVAATVGDIAELGDVDMYQRAGMIMLVAPQWLAGDAVDVG
jgi:hypothetical protein